MNPPTKRATTPTTPSTQPRKKQWRTPNKHHPINTALTINPGDAGIWATCDMHKEGKATAELRDLFEEYAVMMFGEGCLNVQPDDGDGGDEDGEDSAADGAEEVKPDIEAEIAHELQSLKASRSAPSGKSGNGKHHQPLFQAVRIDVQCVLFFKTRAPVEPVGFVERICRDAAQRRGIRRSRCVKRLTPMTRMGRGSWEGLEGVAAGVLTPIFHEGEEGKKFAIRPTIRNHSVMKRDEVIKKVAQIVGPKHSVDLKNYHSLILVDIYRNVLGMSVVGSDFEELKRFNLAEIYDPTPRPQNVKIGATKIEVPESGADKMGTAKSAATATTHENGKDGDTTTEPSTKNAAESDASKSDAPEPDEVKPDAMYENS